jgi:hypothetical protein
MFHILRNPIYLGRIAHKGVTHEGKHIAIIEKALFEEDQQKLDRQADGRDQCGGCVAERVGFEPTVRLPVRRISSAVLSTTQPPLPWPCRLTPGSPPRSRRASSSGDKPCLA